jgi:hypothetical protein
MYNDIFCYRVLLTGWGKLGKQKESITCPHYLIFSYRKNECKYWLRLCIIDITEDKFRRSQVIRTDISVTTFYLCEFFKIHSNAFPFKNI